MKKYLSAILILLVLTSALYGCTYNKEIINMPLNQEVLVDSSEETTPTSITMSYDSFTGYRIKTIELDACETCEVFVDIVSEDGAIDISITDNNGESYYEGNSIPTSNFSVLLAGDKSYTLKVKTLNHIGSFNIQWNIIE